MLKADIDNTCEDAGRRLIMKGGEFIGFYKTTQG
jgi:hypothetical protein